MEAHGHRGPRLNRTLFSLPVGRSINMNKSLASTEGHMAITGIVAQLTTTWLHPSAHTE